MEIILKIASNRNKKFSIEPSIRPELGDNIMAHTNNTDIYFIDNPSLKVYYSKRAPIQNYRSLVGEMSLQVSITAKKTSW